jgi:hypothetical protein
MGALREALSATPYDPAVCTRLATECRFGFHQSLQEHPDDPDARAGLQETLVLLAERELHVENAAGVAALLSEMPCPESELRTRLDALVSKQQTRTARDQARTVAQDARIALRERGLIVLGCVAVVAISQWRIHSNELPELEAQHWRLVRVWSVICAVCVVLWWLGRKRLRANSFNRTWVGAFATGMLAILVHRALALHLLPGAWSTLMGDPLIAAAVFGTGAATGKTRWMWPMFACFAAAIAITVGGPGTPFLINGSMVVILLAILYASRSDAKQSAEDTM